MRNDFNVKYIAYRSRPDFWITANLYIPKNIVFPAPTVMILHGHTDDGKATGYYQVLVQNLVKKGFVVFFKDGIGKGERIYTGPNYGELAPFTYMSGISVEGLETWDNIRAVDLLWSNELSQWVDQDRIGVAGMSGGSMQAFYLTAVDERIKVAAPVSQRNTFTAEFKLWDHCICCVCASGIRKTAEQYHMLATLAPRPVVICSGTKDKNHPIEGARHLVSEARKVYALYGKDTNLELIVDDVGHELSPKFREAIYSLFNEHFNVDATNSEEPIVPLTREQLNCGLPGESTATVATLVYRASLDLPHEKGVFNAPKRFERYREHLVDKIRNEILGYAAYMPNKCDLEASVIKSEDKGKYIRETVSYRSEPDIHLNAIFSYPKLRSNLPVIISINNDDDVDKFHEAGYAILSVALRPDVGNSRRYGSNWGAWARGMSCGKPSTGMRIYDVLRSIDYLETRAGLIDSGRIGCLGISSSINAMYALYAAALDRRIQSVVLVDPITTYVPATSDTSSWHTWDLDMYIPQVLLHGDVSQVASLIAPTPLFIVGGRDMGNQPLSADEVKEKLYSCVHSYELLNGDDNLHIQTSGKNADYINWFDKSFSMGK